MALIPQLRLGYAPPCSGLSPHAAMRHIPAAKRFGNPSGKVWFAETCIPEVRKDPHARGSLLRYHSYYNLAMEAVVAKVAILGSMRLIPLAGLQ